MHSQHINRKSKHIENIANRHRHRVPTWYATIRPVMLSSVPDIDTDSKLSRYTSCNRTFLFKNWHISKDLLLTYIYIVNVLLCDLRRTVVLCRHLC